MTMQHWVVGFIVGLFVGVVSASTLEVGKIGITQNGVIGYLNQVCAD